MNEPQVLAPPSPAGIRAELTARLLANIVGPEGGEHEELDTGAVREYYLVGMLAPRVRAEADAEAFDGQQDTLAVEGPSDVEESAPDVSAPPPGHQLVPSSLGMTFGVTSESEEIRFDAHWGRYERVAHDSDAATPKPVWRRAPAGGNCDVVLRAGAFGPLAPDPVQPEVVLRGRMRRAGDHWVVTVFLVNNQIEQKVNKDEAWAFQAQVGAEDAAGRTIFLKPWDRRADDVGNEETRALDMAYRNDVELAVGHATGVHVVRDPSDRRRALRVETTAVPVAEVAATVAPGAADIPELAQVTLDMAELAAADDEQLARGLRPLVSAYRSWIGRHEARIGDPGEHLEGFEEVAESTLAHARRAASRIEAGIDLLDPASVRHNPDASEAFRFANRAMWQQRVRSQAAERRLTDPGADHDAILAAADQPEYHSWRPFQLGFVLVNLPSLADPGHSERGPGDEGLVDLLWFPTGGGKTEAYLGLAAFTLAIRRLQGSIGGYDGTDGVGVLMRYTLRLLTVQQFQRAAALICACEVIRREAAAAADLRWGEVPFRLGLWVGAKVTPTRTAQAARSISETKHSSWYGGGSSPVKVTACPWCGTSVDAARDAEPDGVRGRTLVFCGDPMGRCPFSRRGAPGEGLPLVTVDHEIYRLVPSMVIATADKFAQLSWEGATRALFGRVTRRCERHGYRHPDLDQLLGEADSHHRRGAHLEARTVTGGPLRPPDLIIQDELHLIAGPLGSLMGLYETAIDHLSTWSLDGRVVRPKVVASTATVRRADVQARQVFWRSLEVFPRPALTPPTRSSPSSATRRWCPVGSTSGSALRVSGSRRWRFAFTWRCWERDRPYSNATARRSTRG